MTVPVLKETTGASGSAAQPGSGGAFAPSPWYDSAFLDRAGLVVLIAMFVLGALSWSLLTPPLYGSDEPQHFIYAREIADQHSLLIATTNDVPADLWRLAKLEYFFPCARWSLHVDDATKVKNEIAAIQTAGAASQPKVQDNDRTVVTQNGFTAQHPPLYYVMLAVVISPFAKLGILWQLVAGRILSIILGAITVTFAYGCGKLLWDKKGSVLPLALAMLVCLQPMFMFSFATIGNFALEITLFSALLLTSARSIFFGFTRKRAIWLSMIVTVGMLTKISFVAALPLFPLLLFWKYHGRAIRRADFAEVVESILYAVVPVCATFWWWYPAIWNHSSRHNLALLYRYPVRQAPLGFNLISYVSHYPWLHNYSKLMSTYWASFGWFEAHLPLPLIGALSLITGLSVAGTVRWWLNSGRAVEESEPRAKNESRRFSVLFMACANLLLLMFYMVLDVRLNTLFKNGHFVMRGQYLIPAIIAQMSWLILSVKSAHTSQSRDQASLWLCSGMFLLNLACLGGVIVWHGVCGSSFIDRLSKLALFTPFPLSLPILISTASLFILTGCFLLLILVRLASTRSTSPAIAD